jgi:hypothetical protein
MQGERDRLLREAMWNSQAIDDDCNQTGQMLAGLLGWPQADHTRSTILAATPYRARDRKPAFMQSPPARVCDEPALPF